MTNSLYQIDIGCFYVLTQKSGALPNRDSNVKYKKDGARQNGRMLQTEHNAGAILM